MNDVYSSITTAMGRSSASDSRLAGRSVLKRSYHTVSIKQCCGVERSQVRDAIKQLAHITLSLRAFLRLERERIRYGVSWYESKTSIIRGAISSYLASPTLGLTRSA
jgi:putative transposase